MPPVQRHDPHGAFRFRVEIDGIAVASFSEVSGLGVEIEAIDYRDGNDVDSAPRKIPGIRKFTNIVLKRGITNNLDLWNWIKSVGDGNLDRRNGLIVLLNERRDPVLTFRFRNGWPVKWEASEFNAQSSEVVIETLEITHEGLEVESA